MAILTADILVQRAARVLNDLVNVRWTQSEALGWLNDGQREVAVYRPDASCVNQAVQLVSGTKQVLPATGLRLLKATRNMGAAGATPGGAVMVINVDILDREIPDWHTGVTVPASASVLRYVYDERDPKTYYVYPPQPAVSPGWLEIVMAVAPTDCKINGVDGYNGATSVIGVDDIYANAVINYMIYRCLSKQTDTLNTQLAGTYYERFTNSLGIKLQIDAQFAPKPDPHPVMNG